LLQMMGTAVPVTLHRSALAPAARKQHPPHGALLSLVARAGDGISPEGR
jgi:hypothetical protein